MFNIICHLVILASILIAFTDRNLLVCVMFNRWGINKMKVKLYFMGLAVFAIIRCASYIWDFNLQSSPPFAVFINGAFAFGMAYMTYKIQKRSYHIRKRKADRQHVANLSR